MSKSEQWDGLRDKIIGLGELSSRKNYYREFQQKMGELERFKSLLDKTADAIFQADAIHGVITDANEAAAQMLHCRKEELYNQSIYQFFPEDVSLEIQAMCNDGSERSDGSLSIQSTLGSETGKESYAEFVAQIVDFDRRSYLVIVVRDITSRKEAERELAESYLKIQRINKELTIAKEKAEESDHLKTSFLQNISHEIRTPMNAIVGFANLMNEPDLTSDRQQEFVQIILQSSKQLLSIITDIVNIASIETGQERIKESEVNLNWVLLNLYEQFSLKAQLQKIDLICEMDVQDKTLTVITDETKLIQVLSNLLGNAFKFTKDGGISFGYQLKGKFIEFYVKDTGIGIPMEMHDEVFKRFRQVSSDIAQIYGGSGLGLSISKAYVELLGGRIWFTSEPGKGSSFYFTILLHRVSGTNEEEEVTAIFSESDKTVLIVEDEDLNYRFLNEVLTLSNFNIIRAANGLEAVEKCKAVPHIDLVLMDIKMPVMDGYEATRKIKELYPKLPIIAQSAYAHDIDKTKAGKCGFSDYINKPIVKSDLIRKIKVQLGIDQVVS